MRQGIVFIVTLFVIAANHAHTQAWSASDEETLVTPGVIREPFKGNLFQTQEARAAAKREVSSE